MNKILASYIPIANMVSETIPGGCEVVLHDLSDPEHSVVYTVNNHITGRKIGQSFNQFIPTIMLDKTFKEETINNYYFHTEDGKLIKSSTALIKDAKGTLLGAMCINIDTSPIMANIEWMQAMLPDLEQGGQTKKKPTVSHDTHVSDLVEVLIDKVLNNKQVEKLSRNEKIKIIKEMEERGIFLIKGSIDIVAKKMGISKVTMYSYIDGLRDKDKK